MGLHGQQRDGHAGHDVAERFDRRLQQEGDPRKLATLTFKVEEQGLKEYAHQNRQRILAEHERVYVRWQAAGKPSGAQLHRCQRWAEVVGGILQVAGFPEFLQVERTSTEVDADMQDLATLAEHVLTKSRISFFSGQRYHARLRQTSQGLGACFSRRSSSPKRNGKRYGSHPIHTCPGSSLAPAWKGRLRSSPRGERIGQATVGFNLNVRDNAGTGSGRWEAATQSSPGPLAASVDGAGSNISPSTIVVAPDNQPQPPDLQDSSSTAGFIRHRAVVTGQERPCVVKVVNVW